MAESSPVRRTGRTRVRNKRYTLDTLQGSDFGDSTGDEDNPELDAGAADDDDEEADDEFDADDNDEADDDEDEEDLDDAADASDEDAIRTDDDGEDEGGELRERREESVIDLDGNSVGIRRVKRSGNLDETWRWTQTTQPPDNNVRGIWGRITHSNRGQLLREAYGSVDCHSVGLSADKFTLDPTLPNRHSGFWYPPGFVDGVEDRSKGELKHWFPPLKVHWQQVRSARESIDAATAQAYLPQNRFPFEILAGPHHQQHKFKLEPYNPIHVDDFFSHVPRKSAGQRRQGWAINVGGRVLDVAWAPVHAGQPQWLAVAVEQKGEDNDPNPFLPTECYPAAIQIWQFARAGNAKASTNGAGQREHPRLVRVICAKWGGVRKLKWCPGLPEDGISAPAGSKTIGFLGAVWTDGLVRVVEVDLPSDPNDIFSLYKTAPFSAKPPDTVCACLDWASEVNLVAACANGYVAIWNVARTVQKAKQQGQGAVSSPRPWFYHAIHETYINDIVSHGPVAPHLLHTVCISGFQQLTDIRNPDVEFVTTLRSRMYQSSAAHSPHMLGSMTTDENGDLVALNIRRFFNSRRLAPTTSGPTGGTVIATSPLHCSVLFGTPDGVASSTNPLQRVILPRAKSSYVQKWFAHEWRRVKPDANELLEEKQSGLRAGIVRMTESYKLEKVSGKNRMKEKKERAIQTAFVFEEEQAVTALAWNPNREFGSWAAVGTGSGLVRVEDLGV